MSRVWIYLWFPDIASPPPEIQVLAAMRGSIVGSPQFFSSGGQVGCCIGFEPAIRQTRKIYISDQFSQSHQSSAAALKWMLRGSDWEMLQSLAAWLRVQVQNPKNSSRAWALLSEGEKQQHQALKDHQYAMTLKSFLSTVSTVDRSRTALGIGLSTWRQWAVHVMTLNLKKPSWRYVCRWLKPAGTASEPVRWEQSFNLVALQLGRKQGEFCSGCCPAVVSLSNKHGQDLWQAGSFTFTGPYLRAASNSSAALFSRDQFTFEVYLAMYLSKDINSFIYLQNKSWMYFIHAAAQQPLLIS